MKMLVLLCFVIFVSSYHLCSCNDCTYSEYTANPIFIQKFGKTTLVLPKTTEGVRIPNGQSVTAICPGDFGDFRIDDTIYEGVSKIDIKCSNSIATLERPVSYSASRNIYYHNRDTTERPYCLPRKSAVCQYAVEGCKKDSYLHKVTIDGVTLVYAEMCYDIAKQTTQFLHYVIAKRSPVLEHHSKFNPGWTSNDMVCNDIGHIADLFNLKDSDKQQQLHSLLGEFSKIVNYESDSLIPKGLFAPYFPEPEFGSWTNIYWWTPLKDGNWQMFQNALKNKSKEVDLDVYAGTSHTISFKTAGKCESIDQIKFNSSTLEKAVPLYVWNYIRQRNSNDSIEVVVIGVNSPFTEVFDSQSKYTAICADICETIPWMNRLKYTMRMPALGYIICCDPNEVRDLLEGFPKDVVSTFEPHEASPKPVESTTNNAEIRILRQGVLNMN